MSRPAALMVLTLGTSCAGATVRPQGAADNPHPAGAIAVRWQTVIHDRDAREPHPGECATGVVVGTRLVIGSRAAAITALDTASGRVLWQTTASGGIDGQAVFDARRGHVYVGADDGTLHAVDPQSGAVRWTYRARGAIDQPSEIGADAVYFATAADRVVALEAATGKWKWQYEREPPEEFTIHGYAAPRLVAGNLLAGFSDGYSVALDPANGEVVWARSLAAASDHFVDVDSTPAVRGGLVYLSSYSGGLYALDPRDGSVRWRQSIEGAGSVRVAGDRLYFGAARDGVEAADADGNLVWRQALPEAGDLTPPLVAGRTIVFSGSRQGLFVVDRETGRLLDVFDRGDGVCAQAALDPAGGRLYVLANGGVVYALDLA